MQTLCTRSFARAPRPPATLPACALPQTTQAFSHSRYTLHQMTPRPLLSARAPRVLERPSQPYYHWCHPTKSTLASTPPAACIPLIRYQLV
eukprot:1376902-Pleurochrysis_carterae.AAC.2